MWAGRSLACCAAWALIPWIAVTAIAKEVVIGHRAFQIPDGYQLQLAAGDPLTLRPICVDFDEAGRLYVAESSGSNDAVEIQLKEKPHRILRLEDTDLDGVYDRREVFADGMMFPEGTLWYDGSLYVAAPPVIWKLTDTDSDGIADEREPWFDGKTLTGCANDLHGPFAGPDGWIYWCKGAFAEQTYERPGRIPLTTRAAHIFRRRPSGGPVEVVMTGGMDNPVEVVFGPGGERFFCTTFLQHPAGGKRDGLIHAIYGGVYGKRHGVLDGHPRTGDLLPTMTHLGAAAPAGLARLETDALGYRGQLATACFNLHQVTRHELVAHGATFTTVDHELISCDDLDFHPTDVIEDADGSLLIVDTGGWYKLCCPTSQLKKPDVHGAIYRLSRVTHPRPQDPRGAKIDWHALASDELVTLLGDQRLAVRRRAANRLGNSDASVIRPLRRCISEEDSSRAVSAVWSLCRNSHPAARVATRTALTSRNQLVVQAGAHAVGLWRDTEAVPALLEVLRGDSLPNRRAAAEALGRIGDSATIPALLRATGSVGGDRILEHSLLYALIEINDARATREARQTTAAVSAQRAALLALDQMESGDLQAAEVCALLVSEHPQVRDAATTIAERHADWGADVVRALGPQLSRAGNLEQSDQLAQLIRLAATADVARRLAARLTGDQPLEAKIAVMTVLRDARAPIESWIGAVTKLLQGKDSRLADAAVRLIASQPRSRPLSPPTVDALRAVAATPGHGDEVRLLALTRVNTLSARELTFVLEMLAEHQPARHRSRAAALLGHVDLSRDHLLSLIPRLEEVSPLELSQVLQAFSDQKDTEIGERLFETLKANDNATALPQAQVEGLAAQFGLEPAEWVHGIFGAESTQATQTKTLNDYLARLPKGDVRRGQRVFHSEKSGCFSCHALGYRGGTVGPDLSRIARVRSKRDLLEAVLFPSRSFVRSYEPVIVITTTGQSMTGTLKDRTEDFVLLQMSATEQRRIATEEVDQMLPGSVSIMPAGMEKTMTEQELADLLAFLESRE